MTRYIKGAVFREEATIPLQYQPAFALLAFKAHFATTTATTLSNPSSLTQITAMLNFKNLVSLSVLASAVAMTSAAPATKRQTPSTCSYFANAALAVRPKGTNGPVTWVGIVSGVTHDGIDGQQASILVTKDDNGNPLTPQQWEFDHCTSLDGHALPADYTPPGGDVTPETYFGIVRPSGATQHCLALESTNDANTNDRNSVLDSRCTDIPEQYRTWFFHSIAASDAPRYLEFADEPTTIVISDTAHGELQFFTNTTKPGQTEMDLVLLAPPRGQTASNVAASMASQAN